MAGSVRFHHGDAFTVHGDHEYRSRGLRGIGNALLVEVVKVGRSLDQKRFETVIVNRQSGGVEDSRSHFAEWALNGILNQPPLQFVGEGALWQLQVRVQGMNAGVPPATITNAINVDRAEDGFERSALPATVSEQGERFTVNDGQSRTDVTGAAKLHVRLQE